MANIQHLTRYNRAIYNRQLIKCPYYRKGLLRLDGLNLYICRSHSAAKPSTTLGRDIIVLNFNSDLSKIVCNQTNKEAELQGRIVKFRRYQVKDTIYTTFSPLLQEEQKEQKKKSTKKKSTKGKNTKGKSTKGNSTEEKRIFVYYIYQKNKADYFITYTNIINLYKALLDIEKLTQLQKNRIYNNLIKYRSIVVSDLNPDTKAFY